MKHTIRLCSTLLCLVLFLGTLTFTGIAVDKTVPEGSEVPPTTLVTDAVMSKLTEFMNASGNTTHWVSNHGRGQTRMCTVSSGTYVTLFTGDDAEADPLPWSLFHLDQEGNVKVLYSDMMPYHPGGPTVIVMADKNEDIWMYAGWRQIIGTERFSYHVYHYDVDKGSVTEYSSLADYYLPENRGLGGGAYSVACLDPERNEIYAIANAGNRPGSIEWAVFDIDKKEWSAPKGAMIDYRYCYSYLFPDGNGGFHYIGLRDVRGEVIFTDVGLNVLQSGRTYHSKFDDNTMIFDEWEYFHIPDAYGDQIELQTAIEKAQYEVLKGMYPHYKMADAFRDSDGLLHFLYCAQDNLTPGWRTVHVVYDVSDGIREVKRAEIDFLGGSNHYYSGRMFQDTTGAFYVLASKKSTYGTLLEFWRSDSPTGDLTFVWAEQLPDHITVDTDGYHVSTSRNGSLMSDVLHMTLYNDAASEWYYFTIDFAALRAFDKSVSTAK